MAPLRRTPRIVVPWGLKSEFSLMGLTSHGAPRRSPCIAQASALAARARVGSVVDAGEVLEVKVGVDLGARDIGVTQELLDAAQLPARLEQVRGEGVPEQVWVHVHAEPLAPRPVGDARLHGARSQPLARAADEERRLGLPREPRPFGQPRLERPGRGPPDRDDARLAALAEHLHGAVAEIE